MASVSAPARPRPASAPPAVERHGKCRLELTIGGTAYRLHPLTPPAGFKVVWSLRKQAEDHSAVYQVAVEKGQPPACTCPDHEINGAVCKHIGALKALGLIPGRKARPAPARRAQARRLAEAPAPAPAGPFAAGFQSAIQAEIRRISGQAAEPEGCLFCGSPFDPAVSRDPHFCASCAAEGGCAVSTGPAYPSLHIDRAGLIRPDLIPLAAFLCAEEYEPYARSIILDHAAAGAPLEVLTRPTPEGWVILEPSDLAGAEEALARGGPPPISGGAPAPADPVAAIDGRPTTLAELVDHEALAYRSWGTPEGDFLARQMERLSQLVRWTGAITPGDHESRMEVWEDDLRRQWEDRGYEAGYAAGRGEGRRLAFDEVLLVLKRS